MTFEEHLKLELTNHGKNYSLAAIEFLNLEILLFNEYYIHNNQCDLDRRLSNTLWLTYAQF